MKPERKVSYRQKNKETNLEDFLSETMQARREGENIFAVLKEKESAKMEFYIQWNYPQSERMKTISGK